ncbi:hypothetical protein [Stenotrophomonas sp.]|uniref:hypothetical protein n=1 Tax=Stenotrophomonas sp. TaxID=69392 RepID=UPI0028B0772B|nr:hypothetical protein [Stenotrophomonas sp.]
MLLSIVPVTTTGAYDEVRQADDGRTLVLRTIVWETDDGERTRVTVHWQLLDDGNMLYEYSRQPPATQAVHRQYCAAQAMNVFLGSSWLSGEGATHAFHCSSTP